MYRISGLPEKKIQVEVYQYGGDMIEKKIRLWGSDVASVSPVFFEIKKSRDKISFDPEKMSEEERQLATSKWQGEMVGIIAVPFGLVNDAFKRGQSKLFIRLDDEFYSTSQMFDTFSGHMGDPVVIGVYTGNPRVTGEIKE